MKNFTVKVQTSEINYVDISATSAEEAEDKIKFHYMPSCNCVPNKNITFTASPALSELVGISYYNWLEIFKPIRNQIDLNAPYDGYMFETYAEELELVKNFSKDPKYQIWTLICEGRSEVIAPGFHIVNRMGYFITDSSLSFNPQLQVILHDPEFEKRREVFINTLENAGIDNETVDNITEMFDEIFPH